jgi:hypothetical protein
MLFPSGFADPTLLHFAVIAASQFAHLEAFFSPSFYT